MAEVETLLTDIAQHAIVLAPVATTPAPDPGDPLPWKLPAAKSDLLLVTGDKLLLRHAAMRGRMLAPGEFVTGT